MVTLCALAMDVAWVLGADVWVEVMDNGESWKVGAVVWVLCAGKWSVGEWGVGLACCKGCWVWCGDVDSGVFGAGCWALGMKGWAMYVLMLVPVLLPSCGKGWGVSMAPAHIVHTSIVVLQHHKTPLCN